MNTYKIGTVPHEVVVPDKEEPVVDYQQRLDYSHLVETIKSLLKKYEGTRVFIYKEHETAAIGSSCIEFDVFYVLIAPEGEEPPKCLRFKGIQGTPVKFDSFAPLSLDWVSVGKLKNKNGLDKDFAQNSDRVFLLQNKSRTFRNIDDETKARFKSVSIPFANVSPAILLGKGSTQPFDRRICLIVARTSFPRKMKKGAWMSCVQTTVAAFKARRYPARTQRVAT